MTIAASIGEWMALVATTGALIAIIVAIVPALRVRKRLERLTKRVTESALAAQIKRVAERAATIGPGVEALGRNVARLEKALADAALASSALLLAIRESARVVEAGLDRTVPFLRGALRRR